MPLDSYAAYFACAACHHISQMAADEAAAILNDAFTHALRAIARQQVLSFCRAQLR